MSTSTDASPDSTISTPFPTPGLSLMRTNLSTFQAPSSRFKIFHNHPPSPPDWTHDSHRPRTLYILDSSFNPPTRAHLRMATSALLHDDTASDSPKTLLLLLATSNADKAPKPAAFEHRLMMMCALARDVVDEVQHEGGMEAGTVVVDVGVTKEAMFVNKAKAIEESGLYDYGDRSVKLHMEQVHVTGYDTLIRLLDTKYYPPTYDLSGLAGLFEKVRFRVTRRTGGEWGDRERQNGFLRSMRDGGLSSVGGKNEWAQKIELVDGRGEDEEVVSSTKVREAAEEGDVEALTKLVTPDVATWIVKHRLYRKDQPETDE